jgi:hypothetical protein
MNVVNVAGVNEIANDFRGSTSFARFPSNIPAIGLTRALIACCFMFALKERFDSHSLFPTQESDMSSFIDNTISKEGAPFDFQLTALKAIEPCRRNLSRKVY